MKKAVKITNWVFVIGLILIVVFLGVILMQEYFESKTPQEPQLPMISLSFWDMFCMTAAFLFITWTLCYGIARLVILIIGLIVKQAKGNPAA